MSTLALALGVDTPAYDRSTPPAMVHLGVGAFARAHLATYTDDLLRAGHPATVAGFSLRHSAAEEQLGPQDGLFTVSVREPDLPPSTRVIGSLTSIATGPDAAIRAIGAPTTAFVSLTVTEKGYEPGGASSAPVVLAAGLDERRRRGAGPLVLASLDNLLDNGAVLRGSVLDAAEQTDSALTSWIDANVQFPSSVVDRMVPATTEADLAEVASRLGLLDRAAVVAEQHRSWVLERVDGAPPFGEVGVTVVDDIGPYQRRKLWLLNGPHSALAYCGLLAGHDTIAGAAADPVVAGFVRRFVAEVLEVTRDVGPAPASFAEASLRRFRNPALGHTCVQVGADGSRKLPQRILPVMATRRQEGLSTRRQALVVAMWLAALTATPPFAGRPVVLDDPAGADLRRALATHGAARAVEQAVGREHGDAVPEVTAAFEEVSRLGMDALEAPR